ncbi:uncharacterized protein LAESUDRAFT_114175 [Laetiporus sulphureus 93-53]|uniref:Uncharacterized protein n=1 Tax=Laetiporus sulphureus 93-53 TaxID=1314785 RepID=A0A165EQ10_9APHY|nr:uncharacterized protein LAESUDRAFT_114175 [Laetiporus sulphureus 93-53]KZT07524.1 hypothetical protein LAESUDRAFT_114175 [Laetiporus sulphureus 93-53]
MAMHFSHSFMVYIIRPRSTHQLYTVERLFAVSPSTSTQPVLASTATSILRLRPVAPSNVGTPGPPVPSAPRLRGRARLRCGNTLMV